MVLRVTLPSRSSVALTTSSRTLAHERHLRKSLPISGFATDSLTWRRIVSYMTKQQLPAVSLLTSDTLEEFKTTDKVVIVSYIAADDKTSNQTYTTLAESLRDEYIFGASSDA